MNINECSDSKARHGQKFERKTGLLFLISLARSTMTSSNRSCLALADGADHYVMFAKHNAPQ
jgi:hypothetical protein